MTTHTLTSFERDIQVAIIGASGGIGSALSDALAGQPNIAKLYQFSRFGRDHHPIDLTDEASIEKAAATIEGELDLVIVATGMLQEPPNLPEKSLRDLSLEPMQKCFAVNSFGPALVAKHFLPLLPRDRRSIFACLSARVGSISDNAIGGWYSYRASKAALNMILKTASIEVARRKPEAVVLGLHPGTVDTNLSHDFQGNVQHEIFTPHVAANHLLQVIDQAGPADSSKCFAWDGQEIEP